MTGASPTQLNPRTPGSGPGAALSVNRLSKWFGARAAFEDVSFDVGYGEVFGFLGPNGAGKTTIVRTLATLLAPTSGTATVAGHSLSVGNGAAIRQRISVMPESPGLYLRLTVTENLAFFADLYGVVRPTERIADVVRSVKLDDRADERCGQLSKGLRQRVALARALLSDPQILFLDEPTANLDPAAARDVHDLITHLRERGVTVVITTHRLEEAERICDRVAILNTTLRVIGRPAELRDLAFDRSLVLTTAAPLAHPRAAFNHLPAVLRWQGDDDATTSGATRYTVVVSDPVLAAPPLIRAVVAAGGDVLSLRPTQRSLEDVYFELVEAPEVDEQDAAAP